MFDLVANPEDKFSLDDAHMKNCFKEKLLTQWNGCRNDDANHNNTEMRNIMFIETNTD